MNTISFNPDSILVFNITDQIFNTIFNYRKKRDFIIYKMIQYHLQLYKPTVFIKLSDFKTL